MKIVTVIGARPQFIKAAAVSREINKYSDIEEIIVHTGQHFDSNMSDIFFKELHIPKPDYNLDINGLSHGAMTGQMLEKIEEVLQKEKPDWTLVYGDTNSTIAGALSASKLHIKTAHVEAGLRSFNMKMPEEINRILTDRISNLLFCPTDQAVENLKNEGFENFDFAKVIKSGDVMQDAAMFYENLAKEPEGIKNKKNFILSTIHRAENTDDPKRITEIFKTLNEIAKETPIILPLHPRTKKILKNLNIDTSNIEIIDPVGYLQMVWLLKNASLVMTDSGGLQKEAFFFKKPCITLRDETEWVELVENGFNKIVGANGEKIKEAYKEMKNKKLDFSKDLYGGGEASKKIVKELRGAL
ncbi:MAG: UDP-N-acetylglucosamine 2-epimerase (non-hydrolyzing) [Epsilonproteobacteria bacterium]|nr:UDP-N-acetylglucosamine 2-epimerase (non-hydrolyzing) [Campylobacterota bacterium]